MANANALMLSIPKGLVTANAKIAKLSVPGAFRTTCDAISRDFNATSVMLVEVQGALTRVMTSIPQPADLPLRVQIAGQTTATLVGQLQSQQTRLDDLNAQLDTALGQSSGIPSWILYAGGAVAAVAIFLGMRKRK